MRGAKDNADVVVEHLDNAVCCESQTDLAANIRDALDEAIYLVEALTALHARCREAT